MVVNSNCILQIVIITYNHENTIARTIDSVLEQITDYKYQIIITDDCSTDSTLEICQKYSQKYPDKIKLFSQTENTYKKINNDIKDHHIYKALCLLDAKYWCYLDGDDYWCDAEKVQIALDFLENNPQYSVFAHDTLVKTPTGEHSFVKDEQKVPKKVRNKAIYFSVDAPFFISSSRIHRNVINFKEKKIIFDYLFFYATLEKGPIHYYDKMMAVYNMKKSGYWTSIGKLVREICSMFPYKLSVLFNFKQDNFCTALQKKYDETNYIGLDRYERLLLFKKIFGVKLGWKIWFLITFRKFGFESRDINYMYINRKNTNVVLDEAIL